MDRSFPPSDDYARLAARAELTLALGRTLFRFGASTQRIIDSMELLHSRLGGERLAVLVTYDAITVTTATGSESCTRMDASHEVAGVNIHGLSEIRRLLLDGAPADFEPSAFRERLAAITAAPTLPPMHPARWLASGAVAGGFGAFNGGDGGAILIAFLAAQVIFVTRTILRRHRFTVYLATLGAVCAGGLAAGLAARLGWSATPDVALVAPALFLIPGVPLITGGIDITRNHNSIGFARIVYTVAIIAAIMLGLALSFPLLTDLPNQRTLPVSTWTGVALHAVWGMIAAAGLALLNNGHFRALAVCALAGGAARLVHDVGLKFGGDPAGATLLAAVATTVVAIGLSERRRMPSVVIAVMGCLTLIPGFYAIVGVRGLFRLSVHGAMPWPEAAFGLQMTLQAIFVALAITVGIIFTVMFLERDSRRV